MLVTVFKIGAIHWKPNQVGFVLVRLGGRLILQIRNFCLILLPDVDPPERRHKVLSYESVGERGCSDARSATYGSRLTGVASVFKDKRGGVISELAERCTEKSSCLLNNE